MKHAPPLRSWLVFGLCWLMLSACAPRTSILVEPQLLEGSRVPTYSHGGSLFQLKNGLMLLALPEENTNLVKIDMRYRYGASMDPRGKTGLAHMVEHLTFDVKPASERPTIIGEYLGQLALQHNAYTTWDATHYTAMAFDDQLDALLKLEFARMKMTCAQLDDVLIERTREVVRNELRQRRDMGLRTAEQLYRDVYGDQHPYSRSVGGTDLELAAISRQDVCDFVAKYYTPASAILVVSGKFDVQALPKRVGALFGRIDKSSEARALAVAAPVLTAGRTRHEWPVAEASAIIAFNAPRFTEPEAVYEGMAIRLLEQRLFEIWKDTSYITELHVGSEGGPRAPLTVIVVGVNDPTKLEAAVDLVLERDKPLTDGLSPTDMGRLLDSERLALLRSVEYFANASLIFTDYLQWAEHRQFVIADLNVFGSMTEKQVKDYAAGRFQRAHSHIISVYPAESQEPATETRATLEFSPSHYELPDWKTSVDESEATRSLQVPAARDQSGYKRFQLKNGLSVVLAPTPGYPVVDIRLVLPGGRAHDPVGQPGVSLLASHLTPILEVTFGPRVDKRWTATVIEAFNLMSGGADPEVGDTATTLHTAGLSTYADGILWKIYWYVRTGGYTKKSLSIVRDLLGRRQENSDHERTMRRLHEVLFGDNHPFTTELSLKKGLERASVDQLKAFKARYYRASGATLIVTGEFPVAYMERQIRRLFEFLPRGQDEPLLTIPPASGEHVHLALAQPEAVQTGIMMAFPLNDEWSESLAERKMLREMLRLEMSSLREQLGATYGVQVELLLRHGPGLLRITAHVDRQRAGETYQAMNAALERIRSGESTAAFVRARRQVLRGLLAETTNSQSVADELQFLAENRLPPDYFHRLTRRVAEMRLSGVTPVIAQDLAAERQVLVIKGSVESIADVYKNAGVSNYEFIY